MWQNSPHFTRQVRSTSIHNNNSITFCHTHPTTPTLRFPMQYACTPSPSCLQSTPHCLVAPRLVLNKIPFFILFLYYVVNSCGGLAYRICQLYKAVFILGRKCAKMQKNYNSLKSTPRPRSQGSTQNMWTYCVRLSCLPVFCSSISKLIYLFACLRGLIMS